MGGPASSAIMDWFEIHYPRAFNAFNNELEIYSDVKKVVKVESTYIAKSENLGDNKNEDKGEIKGEVKTTKPKKTNDDIGELK